MKDYENLKVAHEDLKKLNNEQEVTLAEMGHQLSQYVCYMLTHIIIHISQVQIECSNWIFILNVQIECSNWIFKLTVKPELDLENPTMSYMKVRKFTLLLQYTGVQLWLVHLRWSYNRLHRQAKFHLDINAHCSYQIYRECWFCVLFADQSWDMKT